MPFTDSFWTNNDQPADSQPQEASFDDMLAERQGRHAQVDQGQRQVLAARSQLFKENAAAQRFENSHAALDLQQAKAQSDILKERYTVNQEITRQKHVTAAIEGIGSLKNNDPEYDLKLATILKNNVMATSDDFVKEQIKNQTVQRQTDQKLQQTIFEKHQAAAVTFAEKNGVQPMFKDDNMTGDFQGMQQAAFARDKQLGSELNPDLVANRQTIRNGKITTTATVPKPVAPVNPGTTSQTKTTKSDDGTINSTTTRTPNAPVVASTPSNAVDPNADAKAWIQANPNDPRAAAISKKLGL